MRPLVFLSTTSLLTALTVVVVLDFTACGEAEPTAESPKDAMQRAQRAMADSEGYRITITGHNLVLPQWGGIDSGTIEVGTDGPVVRGNVERTSDGPYALVSLEGETYFQRSTCDHMARVPGGGGNVVRPFLLGTSGALGRATNVRFDRSPDDNSIALRAEIEDLGDVLIELDAATYLPVRLLKEGDPNSGSQSEWLFSEWGQAPPVSKPTGTPPDQGPGGNPC